MKTVALALACAAIVAAPAAFAQPAPAQMAQATPAAAPAKAKTWKVGDRMPGAYVARRYEIADPAVHQLTPAPVSDRWLLVGDKAYRINERTDQIKEIVPVTSQVATTTTPR